MKELTGGGGWGKIKDETDTSTCLQQLTFMPEVPFDWNPFKSKTQHSRDVF